MAFFMTQRLHARCVEVNTLLNVPVSLPTGDKVAPHGNCVSVVQTALVVQAVHIVLPVETHIQRLKAVLANPLKAALQQGSFQGSLRRRQ